MRRKIILSVLSILILLCTVSLIYEKINKDKTNEGMFAIYLEKEKNTGKYEKSNLKTWPTEEEYAINMQKTYCENGSILRWNLETKRINVTVKGTDKCYVYFDKAEYGSKEHPHLIQTIEDLIRLSNDVNSGTTYAGEYFLLTNDLDFKDPSDYEDANRTDFLDINGINGNEALITELTTGSGFVPIGNSETNSFQGIFDGNNHTLSNLYIDNNDKENIGLFGFINNVNINNFYINGIVKSKISANIGGLVGTSYGSITLKNVHNNVEIANDESLPSNDSKIGGFIGYVQGGTLKINNSSNFGKLMLKSGSYIGGFLGYVNNSNISINNSYNSGTIMSNVLKLSYGGGFIGYCLGQITINDSYNTGDIINLSNKNIQILSGGMIGYLNNSKNSKIYNSYNKGNIIDGNMGAGFIAGTGEDGLLILDKCYNEGDINVNTEYGSVTLGGLIGDAYVNVYILNSYNINDIYLKTNNAEWIYYTGLITIARNKLVLLNSYTNFNITTDISYVPGNNWKLGLAIIIDAKRKYPPIINNCYNLSDFPSAGLVGDIDFNTYKPNIKNIYYKNENIKYGIGNLPDDNVLNKGMSDRDMQQQTFVDELNQNIEGINLEEIDSVLKDYSLSKWTLGSDGYPTLIND